MSEMSRRRFLRYTMGAVAGFGTAGIGGAYYTTRIEPENVGVSQVSIPLRNLAPSFNGLTIAQVSDWHMGEWMTLEHMLAIAAQTNALKPDIIALTGDFVSAIWSNTPGEVTRVLQTFNAPQGIFATLGNHDHWTNADTVRQMIHDAGNITLLDNANRPLQRGSDALYMVGVDDIWERKNDLNQALDGVPNGAATVLLAHEPDYADHTAGTGRIGLQLSGHSHGGQVRIPLIGAPNLPWLGQKYDMGLYSLNGMALYVNRGVGMIAPYVRLNCRPEITLLTLATA